MTSEAPKLSVLMPVYNGEDYLQESIDSILQQSYSGFEFLIIDDCSTDNTWNLLLENSRKDSRIVLLRNLENIGLIKTLNKGLRAARGEYIARQDADDISLQGRLLSQVNVLDSKPNCAMVSSNIQVITNSSNKPIEVMKRACEPELVSWHLIFHNHIGGHSQVMYRKNTILSLNGYSEKYPHIEDYELWCRLSSTGQKIVILPNIFLSYRRHSQSISAIKSHEQEQRLYQQVENNLADLLSHKFSIEEIKYLVGFWKGKRSTIWDSWHHRFPPADQAAFIHLSMLEISHAFAKKYRELYPDLDLKKEIDRAIGSQFLYWLQSPLTAHHTIISKVKITRYAILWNFPGVPLSWSIWLLRYPIDLITSLVRKLAANQIGRRVQA